MLTQMLPRRGFVPPSQELYRQWRAAHGGKFDLMEMRGGHRRVEKMGNETRNCLAKVITESWGWEREGGSSLFLECS
jgi:hypothetical protein